MATSPYVLFEKARRQFLQIKPSADVFGPSSEIFVGKYGYPHVAAGPMVGIAGAAVSPREMFGRDYADILAFQTAFIRGNKIFEINSRLQQDMQEVALSERPIDVEMQLAKIPNFEPKFDNILKPLGASAMLKKFMQAENPKIPGKVDSVIHDDITATTAVEELLNHGFDNYYITNIFSVGTLGMERSKRLVPTRWSITAIDDIIGKQRMEEIREFPELNEIIVFSSSFLDNHFYILLMPGKWEFENFESWPQNGMWAGTTEEYEGFYGRSDYAEKQVGGYYASRFSVVEHLHKVRKQAKVVVFREIGEGYTVPVGVFLVRETVSAALKSKKMEFSRINDAINWLSQKLNVPIRTYLSKSKILCQTRIIDF